MKKTTPGVQEQGPVSTTSVVQGNNEFALGLYQQLREEKGNLFFSPYSISTALAMTYAGARGNTAAQMAQALRFVLPQALLHPAFAALEAKLAGIGSKGQIQLKVANALWPQRSYPFLEAFLALVKQHYGVLITPVDYGAAETARRTINAWVEEKTQQKIMDLIPPNLLTSRTRLVLTNAIYFKGNWANQFDKKLSKNKPFFVTPGEKVDAPLMTQERAYRYAAIGSLQVLELPYVGDDLAMVILLPDKLDGLAELEADLTAPNLQAWLGGLSRADVRVSLPRFKISRAAELKAALSAMGMPDAFIDGKANFAGMDGKEKWLYIAAALHKAFVDVNEEGTEAAAATAVVMNTKSMPMPPAVFCADHPFVFLIRDKSTGSILFLGRVANPLLTEE